MAETLLASASMTNRPVTPEMEERTQHGSNHLLVFRQNNFYQFLSARNHAPQRVAVHIEHAAEEPWGV